MGCPDCMLLFSSEEEMMGHFTLPPHQPPPFSQPNKCPVVTCDMNFPNRSKLILHMREGRHGQPCPQCGKSFPKVCYFNRQLISRKNVSFILISVLLSIHSGSSLNLAGCLNSCVWSCLFPGASCLPSLAKEGSFLS